jgi:hypothetical protein
MEKLLMILVVLERIPHFPDIADQIGTRFQNFLAGFPAGGTDLGAFFRAHMLVSLNLTDGLAEFSADRGRQHFHGLNNAVRIDDESAAEFDSGVFILDAEQLADIAGAVGGHMERDVFFDHLGQFIVVPNFVHELAVHADRNHFNTEFLQSIVLCSDR